MSGRAINHPIPVNNASNPVITNRNGTVIEGALAVAGDVVVLERVRLGRSASASEVSWSAVATFICIRVCYGWDSRAPLPQHITKLHAPAMGRNTSA